MWQFIDGLRGVVDKKPWLLRAVFAIIAVAFVEWIAWRLWSDTFSGEVAASAAGLAIATVLWAVAFWDWLATLGFVREVAPFTDYKLERSHFLFWGPPLFLVIGILAGHVFWHGNLPGE